MSGNAYERQLYVGPFTGSDATRSSGRASRTGEQVVSQVHGNFYEGSSRGKIFMANAIVTAPVIWTTEAGTGGPLLWNNSSTTVANILAVGFGISVVSTVAGGLGITGGYGQTDAPTSTTAIDNTVCLNSTSTASAVTAYRVGTTGTNRYFFPLMSIYTGALTTQVADMHWIRLDGLISVPYQGFVSVAASATLSTLVVNCAIIWEEVPV